MAITVKALELLLRVKRRRVEQAEAEVRARLQAQRQREAEREQAQQAHRQALDHENECAAKIDAMCSRGFLPHHLLAMQMVHKDLQARTGQALQGVHAAEQQVQQAVQAVVDARRAVQKAQQVVEVLEERKVQLLRDIENGREELQDEESEEAAVARMLAAQKAQAAA